ncbi:MAG: carboxylesterase/lipase family protein [Polyangiales bacterium]
MRRWSRRGRLCLWLTCAGAWAACDDDERADDEASTAADAGPEHDDHAHAGAGAGAGGASGGSGGHGGTAAHDDAHDPLHVTVADGPLEGTEAADGKARAFLGIPYAKPPVGELRWKPAERPETWSSPRAATEFGGRCAQLESTTLMNAASETEDCLYLNVWAPAKTSAAKLPVMFWIHGGGNVNGSASEPVPYVNSGIFYSGEHIAANQDVVVVTINYRLGLFGFFAHPDLKDEDGALAGNQGLDDQRVALEWVKTNIAKFGGDPEQVTIFGESAGSLDVCLHVASPKSRGLFHRAISQSGGCTTYQTPAADAATRAADFAAAVGCTGDDALACLRGKSVADLLAKTPAGSGAGFGPIVDGEFLPDQPRALYDRGETADVPYILGSNTDEGTLFTLAAQIPDEAALKAAITRQYPTVSVDDVLARYPLQQFDSAEKPYQAAFARILGDASLVCSTYDAAVRHAAAGRETYMYNFDIAASVAGLGATHGSELVYVFGTGTSLTDPQRAISDQMQTYWANLGKTGDPNGGDLPTWPKFSADANKRVNFALEITEVDDFRAAECELWRGVYEARFSAEAK